jgi:hypothetical protein
MRDLALSRSFPVPDRRFIAFMTDEIVPTEDSVFPAVLGARVDALYDLLREVEVPNCHQEDDPLPGALLFRSITEAHELSPVGGRAFWRAI